MKQKVTLTISKEDSEMIKKLISIISRPKNYPTKLRT